MINPALEASVVQLELLLQEELGVVDGFRRALQDAPANLRPGLLLCQRFHKRCISHLRKLIDAAGGPDEEDHDHDFEIVDAFDEPSSSPSPLAN